MRILHALHAFPPESRGGSENYVEGLAREQQRSHEVLVLHRVSQPEREEFHVEWSSFEGIPVARLNHTFRDVVGMRGSYCSPSIDARFAEVLDRWSPEIIHFHHLSGLSMGCVDAARERGVPVLLTLHDFWLLCPRGQLLRRDLSLCGDHTEEDCLRCVSTSLHGRGVRGRLRRFLRRPAASSPGAIEEIRERQRHVRELAATVDAFVSPSRFVADRFSESGFQRDRIRVIDNGFDRGPWESAGAPAARRSRAAGAPLRVAYLGTWIPSKGVHLLIEAVRDLQPCELQLTLHGYAQPFDGFPDYEGSLRDLARGVPHIHFGTRYEPSQVPALLAEADVLVVPSLWYENAPLTVQEAFLAGIPVVAPAHGGLLERIRHEHNGLLFEAGSVESLRAALERLLREPALLDRLQQVRSPVTSMSEHADELESLYREVSQPGAPKAAGAAAQTLPSDSPPLPDSPHPLLAPFVEGAAALWRAREDLQRAFPSDREREYWYWLLWHGIEESAELARRYHGPPPRFLMDRILGQSSSERAFRRSGLVDARRIEGELRAAGFRAEEGGRLLDFGAGAGRLLPFFSLFAGRLDVAVADRDREALEWCGKTLPVTRCDPLDAMPPAPYPDDSFDALYAYSVFSHLPESSHRRWLEELARISRPGALLVVTTHGRSAARLWADASSGERERPSSEELRARLPQLERNGFLFFPYRALEFREPENNRHFEGWDLARYGSAFILEDYVRRQWSDLFEIVAYHEAPDAWQDHIVMRCRGAAPR